MLRREERAASVDRASALITRTPELHRHGGGPNSC